MAGEGPRTPIRGDTVGPADGTVVGGPPGSGAALLFAELEANVSTPFAVPSPVQPCYALPLNSRPLRNPDQQTCRESH